VSLFSLHTLKPKQWLGDKVINGYLALPTKNDLQWYMAGSSGWHSMFYSTFFYTKLANLMDTNAMERGYAYNQVKEWGT
jgi:Ulp1 family protease